MSFEDQVNGVGQELDELAEALQDFRLSVHGWSEAVYSRPRSSQSGTAVAPARRRSWRLAAGWALGCVLVAGSLSGGGLYEHRQQQMRIAAERVAEQQRLAAQEMARQEEEDLLAKVDSDVSRQVPSAMEPLAQLMTGDVSQ
jgi:uncharacterized protein HemX